jgi:hypothetical protein
MVKETLYDQARLFPGNPSEDDLANKQDKLDTT